MHFFRAWAFRDAAALSEGGVDALLIENYGDTPFFPRRTPPHTLAIIATIAAEIRSRYALPLGINVLRNDGMGAIAIASAVEAAFIRVNVYTGARLTDQGIIQGEAHRLLRYRSQLASRVCVFADVAVKHSAPIAERPLSAEVEDTVSRGRADAIIVSGIATGQQTAVADLEEAKLAAGSAPVFAGSGITVGNVADIPRIADGIIVGTALKEGGVTANPVDPSRVREFMDRVQGARG